MLKTISNSVDIPFHNSTMTSKVISAESPKQLVMVIPIWNLFHSLANMYVCMYVCTYVRIYNNTFS